MTIEALKNNFVRLCLERGALMYGDFTLNSGVKSDVFFNSGVLSDAESFGALVDLLVQLLVDSQLEFDVLIGLPYKGISIAAAICVKYWERTGRLVSYAYHRKELKDHGEKSLFVGHDRAFAPGTRVVIIDDVLTSGKALFNGIDLVQPLGVSIVGVVVILNREAAHGIGEGRAALHLQLLQPLHDLLHQSRVDQVDRQVAAERRRQVAHQRHGQLVVAHGEVLRRRLHHLLRKLQDAAHVAAQQGQLVRALLPVEDAGERKQRALAQVRLDLAVHDARHVAGQLHARLAGVHHVGPPLPHYHNLHELRQVGEGVGTAHAVQQRAGSQQRVLVDVLLQDQTQTSPEALHVGHVLHPGQQHLNHAADGLLARTRLGAAVFGAHRLREHPLEVLQHAAHLRPARVTGVGDEAAQAAVGRGEEVAFHGVVPAGAPHQRVADLGEHGVHHLVRDLHLRLAFGQLVEEPADVCRHARRLVERQHDLGHVAARVVQRAQRARVRSLHDVAVGEHRGLAVVPLRVVEVVVDELEDGRHDVVLDRLGAERQAHARRHGERPGVAVKVLELVQRHRVQDLRQQERDDLLDDAMARLGVLVLGLDLRLADGVPELKRGDRNLLDARVDGVPEQRHDVLQARDDEVVVVGHQLNQAVVRCRPDVVAVSGGAVVANRLHDRVPLARNSHVAAHEGQDVLEADHHRLPAAVVRHERPLNDRRQQPVALCLREELGPVVVVHRRQVFDQVAQAGQRAPAGLDFV
ncbi:orotate phosphoribosyltransferase [Babesia caballi]|uniref:orotate phosphoribosyltransferase n=1 Tax=Babesia caballi TaxID=5871 RepID=A0AAV4M0E9_BABCB|nr:orotate phosphoribosyltransferase [Babesia caballi]